MRAYKIKVSSYTSMKKGGVLLIKSHFNQLTVLLRKYTNEKEVNGLLFIDFTLFKRLSSLFWSSFKPLFRSRNHRKICLTIPIFLMLLVKDNLMLIQDDKLSSHETVTRPPEGLATLFEYNLRTLLQDNRPCQIILLRISSPFKGPHNKLWKRGSQQKHGVIWICRVGQWSKARLLIQRFII